MKIKCSFRHGLKGSERYYVCHVTEAVIADHKRKIEHFIGDHLPGKSNNGVEAIEFKGAFLDYFPRGLAQIFPFLKSVTIDNCGLKAITRDDLIGLENLEEIVVKNNPLLRLLPSNLFIGFSKLKRIDFSINKIECLSSKMLELFRPQQLTYVDFTKDRTQVNILFNPAIPIVLATALASWDEFLILIDKQFFKPDDSKVYDSEYTQLLFDSGLAANFQELWISKRFSDFTITTTEDNEIDDNETIEFKVHKNLLGTQSSVFAAIFENDMKEKKDGIMHIEDFCAETVEDFLHFLYTGEIEASNAMDLFAIAAKYEVKLLREHTEEIIVGNIDQSNAIEVFCLGHLYHSEKIQSTAMSMIKIMFHLLDVDDSLLDQPETLKNLADTLKRIQKDQKEVENMLKSD